MKSQLGTNNNNYIDGRTLQIHYCKEPDCNNIIGYTNFLYGQGRCRSCSKKKELNGMYGQHFSKECQKKRSQLLSKKNNPFYGKTLKPHWGKYKAILMRSNWEILFTQFLDLNGIKWFYEYKTFDLDTTTYTPDFYIPEWDLYIEIKGWFSPKSKEKIKQFNDNYSEINFKIFKTKELNDIGITERK